MKTEKIAADIINNRPKIFYEKQKTQNHKDLVTLLKSINYQPYLFDDMPKFFKEGIKHKFDSVVLAKKLSLAGYTIYIDKLNTKVILHNYGELDDYLALDDAPGFREYFYIKDHQFEKLKFMISRKN